MAGGMEGSEQNELKKVIVDAVKERWRTKQSALLLSQLGHQFATELQQLNTQRLPLKAFVETVFGDELSIVQQAQHGGLVHGAVPKDVGHPDPDDVLPQRSEVTSRLRFIPAIWAALHRNIKPGETRVIFNQDGRYGFRDLGPSDAEPSGKVAEITAADIVPNTATKEEAVAHVASFLSSKGFNPVDFAMGRSASASDSTIIPGRAQGPAKATLLDEVISLLSPIELRQTVLPLSVVAKLRHRAVR